MAISSFSPHVKVLLLLDRRISGLAQSAATAYGCFDPFGKLPTLPNSQEIVLAGERVSHISLQFV